MGIKTVIVIGTHPLTTDAKRQYADLGYEISCMESLAGIGPEDIPDEVFVATECAEAFIEDTRNIDAIRNVFSNQVAKNVRIHLLLHSQDTFALIQKRNICEGISENVDLYPFTFESLWGQKLFCGLDTTALSYPHVDRIPIGQDSNRTVHLVIFGLNSMAESIARHAALTCHYPNFTRDHTLKTRITIVDNDIEEKRDVFISKNSALFENSFYRFVDLDNTGETAVTHLHRPAWDGKLEDFVDVEWEFVKGNISKPVMRNKLSLWSTAVNKNLSVILCQENPGENISSLLQMPKEIEENGITTFIRLSDSHMTGFLTGRPDIYPFGMKETCHDVRLPLLTAAKMINYVYNCCYEDNYEKPNDSTEVFYPLSIDWTKAESLWRKLGNAKKWSNIYNAMTLQAKMRSLGHSDSDWDAFFSMSAKEIAVIAETEHNRWNVEELLLGFRPADEKQREEIEQDISLKRKYKDAFIHYDIRAYKDLRADDTGRNVNTYDICLSSAVPLIAEAFRKEVHNG